MIRPMSRRRVVVIGGGVAGLSAGAYLRMNGYDVEILEMAGQCGGVAVGWKRKGYVFDGATTWLPGSAPPLNMHSILSELVDFDRMRIVDFDEFITVEHGKEVLHVYTDAGRLRDEMLRISPGDRKPVEEFTAAILKASTLSLPVDKDPSLYGVLDVLRAPRRFSGLRSFIGRWGRITIEEYSRRFSSRKLSDLFLLVFPRHGFFSVLSVIFSLSWMHLRCAGYPVGGSAHIVGLIEERYRKLGGVLRLDSRVDRILTEGDRAVGVLLDGGEEVKADHVVSAADGHDTIFRMLGGRYLNAEVRRRYETLRLFPANIQVSLGVARTFEKENFRVLLPFDEPFEAGDDRSMTHLMLKLSNIDPTFAPEGKTSIVVQLRTHDHAYWSRLRHENRDAYAAEKRRAAEAVIDALDRRYGDVRSRVEAVDVATPASYVRYTGVWKGSYQGWAPAPGVLGMRMDKTLPGLKGFFMAGQWVEPPGGLPRVVISGRNVAQLVCRADGVLFQVT